MSYKKLPVIPNKDHLKKRLGYLKKRNPEVTERLSLDTLCECPFCKKSLVVATRDMSGNKGINGRKSDCSEEKMTNPHITRVHLLDLLAIYERAEAEKPLEEIGDPCPLCGETWISMNAHIKEAHDLSWEEFVATTGYKGGKVKETESHRNSVAASKLAFYQTDKGREYRRTYRYVGDANPAKRPEVREKISRAALGRPCSEKAKTKNSLRKAEQIANGTFKGYSSGYGFHLLFKGREYFSRSFAEFRVLLSLLEIGKNPDVEPCRVPYIIEGKHRNYIPDFKVDNVYYEVKVTRKEFDTEKYKAIKSTGLDLRFLNNSVFYESFKNYPLDTYAVYQKIQNYVENGLVKITLPTKHHGEHTLLLNIFGEDYLDILKKAEETYYENKKSLCRS